MKFLRVFYAILREIFDESAYERFCAHHAVRAGTKSYERFLRERECAKMVKCC